MTNDPFTQEEKQLIKDVFIYMVDSINDDCFTEEDRKNFDSVYHVSNSTNNFETANDMLQGYNLINKKDDVVYSIVRYEQPLILEKEVA